MVPPASSSPLSPESPRTPQAPVAPARPPRSRPAGRLTRRGARFEVTRTDIRWSNISRDVVRLVVTVHNRGDETSRDDLMQVNAAVFGAFVDSKPVARIGVPPIPPRGSVQVAADFEDPRGSGRTGLKRLPSDEAVAPQERIHWAGNFDVHIRRAEAERHASHAVRLEAGIANYGFFYVGAKPDAYRFDLRGGGTEWSPRVLDASRGGGMWLLRRMPIWGRIARDFGDARFAVKAPGEELALGAWHSFRSRHPATLEVRPPAGTVEGTLTVGVTQRSTGKEAIVEFGFGPDTVEPRCFRS